MMMMMFLIIKLTAEVLKYALTKVKRKPIEYRETE